MSWIDLHMHSTKSDDGDYSPKELMKLCKESGVRVAALADHNSVAGVKEAAMEAKKQQIRFIPAVELDCQMEDVNLHLLGYGITYPNAEIDEIEAQILKMEQGAAQDRVRMVRDLGIVFDDDRVESLSVQGVITGEMIAEAALEKEENKENPLMLPFYPGGSRSDNPFVNFYWDFCAKGKAAYVPMNFISLEQAVNLVHRSGGMAVLAHPGNNIGRDEELLREIVEYRIDGIEVYSSYHDEETVCHYEKQAAKYHLISTVGSDFHGKTKPRIKLGSVSCKGQEEKILCAFGLQE